MEVRDLQDWVIEPYLLQTAGVADVTTFGGPLKQFHIVVNPDQLRKYDLTLSDVEDAITKNNQNTGGNIIERGGQGFAVRGLGAIRDQKDIENIVLTSENGVPIFVRDVASVEIAPPPPSGVLGYSVPDENLDVNNGVKGLSCFGNMRIRAKYWWSSKNVFRTWKSMSCLRVLKYGPYMTGVF